ncbi:unnamed protein product [Blepharisma stoltei]|uniref:EF-hand domain-containing protein n=1 Tax=Blepharisma stoltei TaxID=1481888 RepID=A0AAU9K659_9CILI|nr:unnamed protein product [Blepharisma stoltei]
MVEDSNVWSALGTCISRCLESKRGIVIPSLGTFTFTSQVSLEGVTSPNLRDRDDRLPVFIATPDLAPNVRAGISHQSGIRPFSAKGISGKVPTTKLNYAEFAILTNSTKDEGKNKVDEAIRHLGESLKAGKDIRIPIEGVGSLVGKNGIVAVVFHKKYEPNPAAMTVTEDGANWLKSNLGIDITRPNSSRTERVPKFQNPKGRPLTAGARQIRSSSQRPISSNSEFLQEDETTRLDRLQGIEPKMRPYSATNLNTLKKFESAVRPQSEQFPRPQQSQSAWILTPQESPLNIVRPPLHSKSSISLNESSQVGNFLTENQAKYILTCQSKDQSNRGILPYDDFVQVLRMLEIPNLTEEAINKLILITGCRSANKIRYIDFIDALTKKSSFKKTNGKGSVASDFTANYNRNSIMPIVNLIWDKKLVIAELSGSGGMRPRVALIPSELLALLKKAGIQINIHQLKAILREGNMTSASALDLLKLVKDFINPASDSSVLSDIMSEAKFSRPNSAVVYDDQLEKIRNFLRNYDLQEVYNEISEGGTLNAEQFISFICEKSEGRIKGHEAHKAFLLASQGIDTIAEVDFCRAFQIYQQPKHIENRGMIKLKHWLRNAKITTEQGFQHLLQAASSADTLDREQWKIAMREFDFNAYEAEILFDALDVKHDNVIDLAEWINRIYEEAGPLQSLRDTFIGHNLSAEDLLIKLNAQGKQRLSIEEMANALQRMDPTLTTGNAVDMARAASGKKGYVDIQDFLVQISQKPFEFEGDWKKQILRKIQLKISGDIASFKKIFEECDERNTGKLPMSTFQDCIYKANAGLNEIEIDRLGRVLDNGQHLVDYTEFLDHLEGPLLPPQDPLKSTIIRIQVFMKQNGLTHSKLLKKMGKHVSVQTFADFISRKLQKKLDKSTIYEVANKFDVNKDGFIDIHDLNATLSGKSFKDINSEKSFPAQRLAPDRAKSVIKDIRRALVAKRMSYYDAFRAFDAENNGVLSAQEFYDGLDKIIELSQPVKDGLFAIMDKQSIGIVTRESFIAVLKDTNIEPSVFGDSWGWENETLTKIRQWIYKENLTVEEAFRAFDKDFDGVINKKDLEKALVDVLKLEERECYSSKVDRLYKLLDTYKRNSIQLSDFKLLFEENRSPEWKESAKQQLGLFLSKNYSDIHESFETIGEMTGKITLDQFISWIEKKQVLNGFNLTPNLLRELFTYFDPHRKGYLTEQDWFHAGGNISHIKQNVQEIKDAIRSNFADVNSAYEYFLSYHNSISQNILYQEFEQAIQALIPNRFKAADIKKAWDSISKEASISESDFKRLFDDGHFMSTFSLSKSSHNFTKTASSNSKLTTSLSISSYNSDTDPLKKLQKLIKASPFTVEEIFKQMDTDASGKLSAIEFRNAMRKLGLGLTARDIELVVSRIDTNNDGLIDWQEFSRHFKDTEAESHIKAASSLRLNTLKDHMSHYMLSPKDAFEQFDTQRSGKLSFNAFSALIKRLCELANEPFPPFNVIKDLFDIIDIRKDGFLDMREWLNTFKLSKTDSWEDSKLFEDVSKLIARNRKLLQLTFEIVAKDGRVEYNQAREILGSVLKEVRLNEEQWKSTLGVAMRSGMVDYRFLLEVYKERAVTKQSHPKPL